MNVMIYTGSVYNSAHMQHITLHTITHKGCTCGDISIAFISNRCKLWTAWMEMNAMSQHVKYCHTSTSICVVNKNWWKCTYMYI